MDTVANREHDGSTAEGGGQSARGHWVAGRLSGLLPPPARAGIVRGYMGVARSSLPAAAASDAQAFASSPRELNADPVELAELPTVRRQTNALEEQRYATQGAQAIDAVVRSVRASTPLAP